MKFSVAVCTDNFALPSFFQKPCSVILFAGISDIKSLFTPFSVVKIQASNMGFFAKFAFCEAQFFHKPKFDPPAFPILVSPSSILSGFGLFPLPLPSLPTTFASCIFAIRQIFAISKSVQVEGLLAFIACFHAVSMPTTLLFQEGVL